MRAASHKATSYFAARQDEPPSRTISSPRRLSREESQRQTRARLIEVGRQHFLAYGLGGAVAEKIAEEAGYSRGALYSNFAGKEDLFVAVMQEEHQRYCELYKAIYRDNGDSEKMLQELRTTYIDMLVNPEWVILWAEFQSEAVRNKEMQSRYRQFYHAMVQDSVNRLTEHIENGSLLCKMSPSNFVLAMSSFAHGLALRQRVVGSQPSERTTRKLIGEVFDTLIRTHAGEWKVDSHRPLNP
ncbi:Transcriptional regulator, TetR family [Granulicella sibirica]|uniref:Transcriptional regulator, TetR family n=2 Tax=Granulicella sibirica TaxID=2479048 RepID=A0A4Q0T058_9BACT|nr:Transcriptional regulator, TetR family [Granulicella sibirica]